MVVFAQEVSPETRHRLRFIALFCHVTATVLASVVLIYDMTLFLEMLRLDLVSMMWRHLSAIAYKGVAVSGLSLLLIIYHALLIRKLYCQPDCSSRFTIKQLGEYSMLPLTSLIPLLLAFFISIAFIVRMRDSLTVGFLDKMEKYDNDSDAKYFVDHTQVMFACCGVNGPKDYLDLSDVDVGGKESWITESTLLKSCAASPCTLPVSCCRTIECSSHAHLRLPTADEDFHDTWYRQEGCVNAILDSYNGLLVPIIPIVLLSVLVILEVVAMMFTQLTFTSFSSLLEAGRDDDEYSVCWLFHCGYPTPEEVIENMIDEIEESESVSGSGLSTGPVVAAKESLDSVDKMKSVVSNDPVDTTETKLRSK